MTSTSGPEDEAQWRRPAEGAPSPHPPGSSPAAPQPSYSGPPAPLRPPAGWRPPTVVQPPPPRALPAQDLARLDEDEQRARTITYGVAMVAGAIILVLLLVLCGRALF